VSRPQKHRTSRTCKLFCRSSVQLLKVSFLAVTPAPTFRSTFSPKLSSFSFNIFSTLSPETTGFFFSLPLQSNLRVFFFTHPTFHRTDLLRRASSLGLCFFFFLLAFPRAPPPLLFRSSHFFSPFSSALSPFKLGSDWGLPLP